RRERYQHILLGMTPGVDVVTEHHATRPPYNQSPVGLEVPPEANSISQAQFEPPHPKAADYAYREWLDYLLPPLGARVNRDRCTLLACGFRLVIHSGFSI